VPATESTLLTVGSSPTDSEASLFRIVVVSVVGESVGDSVKDSDKGVVSWKARSGHEDTGPSKGFKNKQEHSCVVPSLVGTLTMSPLLPHTTSPPLPVGENIQ